MKQVNFRLISRNEFSCRRHERCSSCQWHHWQSIAERSGGQKPRSPSAVLKVSAVYARRTATILAKECSSPRGNAKGSALPATGSPTPGRNFLLDSGAWFDIIARDELTVAELKTMCKCKPIRLNTACGILKCDRVVDIYVSDLDDTFAFHRLLSCRPVCYLWGKWRMRITIFRGER